MASREAGNGEQQAFETGATRSASDGKIDFEGHLNPEVLAIFGDYMHRHRVQRDGQLRASDNWQQGIPVRNYVSSLIRHVFEFWRMWRGTPATNADNGQFFTFRDVLCAIMFNVMGILYEMNQCDCLDVNSFDNGTRLSFKDVSRKVPANPIPIYYINTEYVNKEKS